VTEIIKSKTGRAYQILLVDDDTAFTGFFKEFLLTQKPGAWVVHTADHYAPALTCIKEHPIDLVILDLKMPIMDGMQLLTLLKRTHPELQVVVLTSMATPENRAQCLQSGAALFFDKTEVADGLDKIYTALETVVTAPAEGFRGMLRQVGLPEVLQMECLGRKSSLLQVTSPAGSGRIYIEDGSIIHAELGTQLGEQALFQLLGLGGGEFLLKPFAKPPRRTIDGHWESLLMEAARLRDEAMGGLAGGPGPMGVAPVPVPRPGATARGGRRIQEVVLCSNTGELYYEWQSVTVEQRIHLLNQIAKLSGTIAQALSFGRSDRLEAQAEGGRLVVVLQPDRRVFIRLGQPKNKT